MTVAPTRGTASLTIATSLPVGPVNLYVLEGEPLTLVDTGPDSASGLLELERGLAACGYALEDLELIVLTHEHPDHVGLAGVIAQRSGAEVAGHPGMAAHLADYTRSCRARRAAMLKLLRRHGVARTHADASDAFLRAMDLWGAPVEITRPLHDGQQLLAGDRTWRVLHRPGHSASDTLLHDEASGLTIGGDHLLAEVSSIAAMFEAAPQAGGDRPRALPALRGSLERTRALDATLVLTGHGRPIEDHRATIDRRLRQQNERADRIAGLLGDAPRTAHDVARELFPSAGPHESAMTVTEVLGHLDLLLDDGRVAEDAGEASVAFRRT